MKKVTIAVLCIVVIFVLGVNILDKPTTKELEYYGKINYILKDLDFFTAFVSDGQISLYNKDHSIINTVEFDSYDRKIALVYIKKEGNSVYFISDGSLDDEYGVVFINDGSDYILDGINSMERVGGNSYIFSSR